MRVDFSVAVLFIGTLSIIPNEATIKCENQNLDFLDVHTFLSTYEQLNKTERSYAIAHNASLQHLLSAHHMIGLIERVTTLSIWLNEDVTSLKKSTTSSEVIVPPEEPLASPEDVIINDSGSLFKNQLRSTFGTFSKLFTQLKIFNNAAIISDNLSSFLHELNENCSDSLEQITITNADKRIFDEWQLPFTAVKVVKLIDPIFSPDLNLSRIFPKMQHFEVISPQLDLNLDELILFSPQLRSLHIPFDGNAEQVLDIIEKLPNLKSLGLAGALKNSSWFIKDDIVRMKNITRFNWVLRRNDDNEEEITIPAFDFNNLKVLEISLGFRQLKDEDFYVILENYSNVEHLTIKETCLTHNQIDRITQKLLKLRKLQFDWCEPLESYEISSSLTKLKSLKQITIQMATEAALETFSDEWKCQNQSILGFRRYYNFVRG